MQLRELLDSQREAIVDRWWALTLGVYPPESARLMRREKDRFQNPVGRVTRESLETLLEGLCGERPAEGQTEALDGIVRIRAVQDLPPSVALAFLPELKRAVREVVGEDAAHTGLDAAIDGLTLQAFDLYVRCRNTIHELRVNEIKRRASLLFERLGRCDAESPSAGNGCDGCDDANGGCGA